MNLIESFVSTAVASFSKEYHIQGIKVPLTIKKGVKVHPFDNSLLPTGNKSVAATFSNAHSMACKSLNPASAQLLALMMTSWYLDTVYNVTGEELWGTLNIPSVLGGCPIITLDQMMVKSENDHLTSIISYLKFIAIQYPERSKLILNILNQKMLPLEKVEYDATS